MKITDQFRRIYRNYPNLRKKNCKITTYNRLHLKTLGFWPIMPKNLPGHWSHGLMPLVSIGPKLTYSCSSVSISPSNVDALTCGFPNIRVAVGMEAKLLKNRFDLERIDHREGHDSSPRFEFEVNWTASTREISNGCCFDEYCRKNADAGCDLPTAPVATPKQLLQCSTCRPTAECWVDDHAPGPLPICLRTTPA